VGITGNRVGEVGTSEESDAVQRTEHQRLYNVPYGSLCLCALGGNSKAESVEFDSNAELHIQDQSQPMSKYNRLQSRWVMLL
jgi:hypothetical protein